MIICIVFKCSNYSFYSVAIKLNIFLHHILNDYLFHLNLPTHECLQWINAWVNTDDFGAINKKAILYFENKKLGSKNLYKQWALILKN